MSEVLRSPSQCLKYLGHPHLDIAINRFNGSQHVLKIKAFIQVDTSVRMLNSSLQPGSLRTVTIMCRPGQIKLRICPGRVRFGWLRFASSRPATTRVCNLAVSLCLWFQLFLGPKAEKPGHHGRQAASPVIVRKQTAMFSSTQGFSTELARTSSTGRIKLRSQGRKRPSNFTWDGELLHPMVSERIWRLQLPEKGLTAHDSLQVNQLISKLRTTPISLYPAAIELFTATISLWLCFPFFRFLGSQCFSSTSSCFSALWMNRLPLLKHPRHGCW